MTNDQLSVSYLPPRQSKYAIVNKALKTALVAFFANRIPPPLSSEICSNPTRGNPKHGGFKHGTCVLV